VKVALCFPRTAAQLHGIWPPLGIIYLGTVLQEKGYKVNLFDSSFDPSLSAMKDQLKRFQPDVVGISTLTSLFDLALEIAEFAKKELNATTILGGPHASVAPAECLRFEFVDFVVIGEGEETLPELLHVIERKTTEDLPSVRGIGLKKDFKNPIFTDRRAPIEPLDKIPIPDRDLLPTFHKYIAGGATNLFAIRGCPYKCMFCFPAIPRIFGHKIRFRSPANIADELDLLVNKYKIREFFFVDDTFAISKPWLSKLSREIKIRGLDIRYLANARCDHFDEEMARLLKDSGCFYVAFGVESGSQNILNFLRKGITVEQIRAAFTLCRRLGLKTHAYLMVGTPGESSETLAETEKLIDEIQPYSVDFNLTTPLLGTDLYDYCVKNNLLNVRSYVHQDYKGYLEDVTPIKLEKLSFADIEEFVSRVLRKRRHAVIASNAWNAFKDLVRYPTPGTILKIIWRYRMYKRMRHMFG